MQRLTPADVARTAAQRGGECLNPDDYRNVRSRLRWRCAAGHEWEAPVASVRHGKHWCLVCSGKAPKTLDDLQTVAEARGGRCLAERYINALTPVEWECAEKHRWRATLNNVTARGGEGTWCPQCFGNARLDLDVAHEVAARRDGLCLSEEYVNSQAPLEWECAEGHTWEASLNSVKDAGSWCPRCFGARRWKTEEDVRRAFEEATGRKAPSTRPPFLGGLELDGYCEELGVAFEYNGKQHYEYVPFFHRNGPGDLAAQQERDRRTEAGCDEEGVALIVIPYWVDDPAEALRKELELLGLA